MGNYPLVGNLKILGGKFEVLKQQFTIGHKPVVLNLGVAI